jgi:hypothetical protein
VKALPLVALPIPNGLWIPAGTEAERCAELGVHHVRELGRAEGEARRMGRRQTAAGAGGEPVASRSEWSTATRAGLSAARYARGGGR